LKELREAMASGGVRDKVFVSYSRDDKKWLDLLLQTLSPLIRVKPNAIWWDGMIKAGQEWREEIQGGLSSAKVAVLLVSPGFLASEFILNEELPSILNAAKNEGVAILWSLVRNCWYERTPLHRFQAVPYQQTHTMRAWNTLSEPELEDLLVTVGKEIDDRLRSDPPAAAAEKEPEPVSIPEDHRAGQAVAGEAGHRGAERLLRGVEDPRLAAEIGDLFVLRRRWPDAKFTYNRMIELAAPYKELSMAWGYEKLGSIYRLEEKLKPASECWKLAQILYRRTRRTDKAAEMEKLLRTISETEPPVEAATLPR
jgi:TIR domain-containing protein